MVDAVCATRATSTILGFKTNLAPILCISSDRVAEKKRVCRILGNSETIRSTSGIKPISSILSASSITRIFTS